MCHSACNASTVSHQFNLDSLPIHAEPSNDVLWAASLFACFSFQLPLHTRQQVRLRAPFPSYCFVLHTSNSPLLLFPKGASLRLCSVLLCSFFPPHGWSSTCRQQQVSAEASGLMGKILPVSFTGSQSYNPCFCLIRAKSQESEPLQHLIS